jgi:hypothetical protein
MKQQQKPVRHEQKQNGALYKYCCCSSKNNPKINQIITYGEQMLCLYLPIGASSATARVGIAGRRFGHGLVAGSLQEEGSCSVPRPQNDLCRELQRDTDQKSGNSGRPKNAVSYLHGNKTNESSARGEKRVHSTTEIKTFTTQNSTAYRDEDVEFWDADSRCSSSSVDVSCQQSMSCGAENLDSMDDSDSSCSELSNHV